MSGISVGYYIFFYLCQKLLPKSGRAQNRSENSFIEPSEDNCKKYQYIVLHCKQYRFRTPRSRLHVSPHVISMVRGKMQTNFFDLAKAF